ncbi:PocR ligand-binding domain-containing protein [Paenibacillus sp. 11B]|uniref:PocR ligand-binding domain-containing protein n=1 Tax=Paenibacillus sp. 11B TaxID=3060965 RepID=UPI00264FFFA6|nr:PocR ligand-binding domain-containing protein [Paenibacillus sp. 11B]MDN8588169.1 PocR ligand-binding domain-containing protein [Paenibacillus sp. 11B]
MFNLADLKDLLSDFYTLTKIRTGIFDDSFHELVVYPPRHSTYCHLIRSDPRAEAACIQCDQQAIIRCKKEQSMYTYQCHAGLAETLVPIKADHLVIGYMMFGQVLHSDSREELWKTIRSGLSNYNLDQDAIYTAYQCMKNISRDVIEAYARTMEMSASYLYLSRKLVLKKDPLAQEIDDYINNHIRSNLSVPALCGKFSISKSRLYKLSEQSFGMGIAEHIRRVRVQHSKKLLGDTDKSIYQIADLVGIPDYNYFTKVFKRETGMIPTAYRREYSFHLATR